MTKYPSLINLCKREQCIILRDSFVDADISRLLKGRRGDLKADMSDT